MTGEHRARIVLLSGPSGAGKSRLAQRLSAAYGWPVVRLDDFYRDADDPGLPRQTDLGIVDWDDPRSWDAEAALASLTTLAATGAVQVPRYDISVSRRIGEHELRARDSDLILAEGVFAAELVAELRAQQALYGAYCVHHHRVLTFAWRLLRDLRERRKPPLTLIRRGWALLQAEPHIVARHCELGALPARAAEVERRLAGAGSSAKLRPSRRGRHSPV